MNPAWPLWIVCLVDVSGSIGMILFSALAFRQALQASAAQPTNPRYSYLVWFCGTLMAFAWFRAGGHILKYILCYGGHTLCWEKLSPFIGGLNTLSFMLIVGVTLFFSNVEGICLHLNRERDKLERMSREILQLNQDLEQIVSERTVAELALRIAHQIRNPVMVIGGLLRRLFKELPGQGPWTEKAPRIFEQLSRLEEIVQSFERLMESQLGLFRTQDLNQIVRAALNLVHPEAEQKGVILEARFCPGRLLFKGHEQLIKVAVVHILRNAIEACHRGDRITIETAQKGGYVYVIIKDTGPGIPPEIMPHIFKPFYSTKGKRTGLGLPYVKQIIEEHRGKIEIQSQPGQGTKVTIALPTHLGK